VARHSEIGVLDRVRRGQAIGAVLGFVPMSMTLHAQVIVAVLEPRASLLSREVDTWPVGELVVMEKHFGAAPGETMIAVDASAAAGMAEMVRGGVGSPVTPAALHAAERMHSAAIKALRIDHGSAEIDGL
jgi:hypothetical protein